MSKSPKKLPDRLEEQAKKLKPFMDVLDRLDSVLPENGEGHFKLPYTTRPSLPLRQWKLTLGA